MQIDKINIGDKVVPVKKTIGVPKEQSVTGKALLSGEVKFLYVVNVDVNSELLVLSANFPQKGGERDGDFYRAEDVVPYKKAVKNDKKETLD